MKTIIVDDEQDARNLLREFVNEYCDQVEIVGDFSNPLAALDYVILHHQMIDLIFLDISMPKLNGLDFLKQCKNYGCQVIFITAHNQFAIQAIRLSALDYILKPIDIQALAKATKRAQKLKNEREFIKLKMEGFIENQGKSMYDKTIVLNTGTEIIRQRIGDITYLEADGNYTLIYRNNARKLIITRQLGKYEHILDASCFVRIHRSFIINIKEVFVFHKRRSSVEMKNGTSLPVSQRRKKNLLDILSLES